MSVPSPIYDHDPSSGAWTTATQNGPTVTSFDPLYRVKQYKVPMTQRAGNFSRVAIGTAGPGDSYLYEETTPRAVGADIIEWDRLYTEVPPDRYEAESFVYNQQINLGGKITEIPIPVNSVIKYSYFNTSDPTSITTEKAYKAVYVESEGSFIFYEVGSIPSGSTRLAEDESVSRWKGDIWEIKRREISNSSLLGAS